jgi:hypothetical protein
MTGSRPGVSKLHVALGWIRHTVKIIHRQFLFLLLAAYALAALIPQPGIAIRLSECFRFSLAQEKGAASRWLFHTCDAD